MTTPLITSHNGFNNYKKYGLSAKRSKQKDIIITCKLLNNDFSYDSIVKVLFVTLIIKSLIIPTKDFDFKEFQKKWFVNEAKQVWF